MRQLERIQQNAEQGEGPCAECPAHETHRGRLVNPGLGNPEGKLVFVTEEPRHIMDWDEYESWLEYNEEWLPRFTHASGGQMINRLLDRTALELGDVWVTDSIKCPTKRDEARGIPDTETDDAFDCCRAYLRAEIEAIDPVGIVTLGKQATIRTLQEFGVPPWKAEQVRVTKEYGRSSYDMPLPLVISLHWAQRTVAEDEWVPDVQCAISEVI